MTDKDFQILELEALDTCLEDDGFSTDEIEEILQRVKAGEDVEEVVLEYREY